MKNIVYLFQIFVSLALITLVLFQPKRGGSYLKRRGIEKVIFYLTVFFGIFFVFLAIVNLLIK